MMMNKSVLVCVIAVLVLIAAKMKASPDHEINWRKPKRPPPSPPAPVHPPPSPPPPPVHRPPPPPPPPALSPPPPAPAVAFYTVALQWPRSVMKVYTGRTHSVPDRFRLHGVWPEDSNGDAIPVSTCHGGSFIIGALQPVRKQLKTYWQSFTSLSDERFWEHEWNDHGVCSNLPLLDYFKKSVDIAQDCSFALHTAFTHSGITPGTEYKLQQFHDAVLSEFHVVPQLSCTRHPKTGVLYLMEVRLCRDARLANYINCLPSGQTMTDRALYP